VPFMPLLIFDTGLRNVLGYHSPTVFNSEAILLTFYIKLGLYIYIYIYIYIYSQTQKDTLKVINI
jgi:hypothetical protein